MDQRLFHTALSTSNSVHFIKRRGNHMKVGRDAKTGQFIPVKVAERRKATAVVETIKTRGKKK